MKPNAVLIICGHSMPCRVENIEWLNFAASEAVEIVQGDPLYEETHVDGPWMRSLADCRAERIRENAGQSDPHHPQRRSKGEKARNRGRRK
ncbi:hypothetical protein [Pseudomonas sp. MPR-ANC1]|uniref:hypothetical protein n=1 Tax=Pseudomonas sp. MPR-ANC1 TaxID=2075548 RepID=UPI0011AEDC02|nr:hypothetical protein [Pseudomonas sp. MPR-ANC1]